VLVGVVSAGASGCVTGSHGLFTYTGAPEILQFIQGNDQPPTAPRETSATFLDIKWDPPLVVGNTLSCSTGGWPAPPQQFTYSFVNTTSGAVVSRMMRTSEAYDAGIRPGDVIVAFNGTTIDDPSQLYRLIADARIGSTATLKVLRNGRPVELKLPIVSSASASSRRRQ